MRCCCIPEGGDWTPTRHRLAVAALRRRGRRAEAAQAVRMPHVLPPKPAGTLAALTAAPDADVVIFTHTGHDELLDVVSIWNALPLRAQLRLVWWREVPGPSRMRMISGRPGCSKPGSGSTRGSASRSSLRG